MIMIDVPKSFDGVTGRDAQDVLDRVGLTGNCNSIPNDPLPPFRPSGFRLGTPAMTTRGLKEDDMALVAGWMQRAIKARNDEPELDKIHKEVIEFALRFPLPSDT
jgi:glycine hydroxymethyltransferase